MTPLIPLLLSWLPAPALAQDAAILVDDYRLEAGGHGLLSTGHAEVLPHGEAFARVWLAQTTRPLVAFVQTAPDTQRLLVGDRQSLALAWSMGLFDRAEVGLSIPVVLHQDAERPVEGTGDASSFGPADMTVHLRGLVLDPGRLPLGLVLEMPLTLATGNQYAYLGLSGPSVEPRLLVTRREGPLAASAGLGVRLQPRAELFNLVDDDKLTWRGAVDLALPLWDATVALELVGATPLRADARLAYRSSGELVGGLGIPVGPLELTAAGGMGVLDGVSSPDWRALLGFAMRTEQPAQAPPAPVEAARVERPPPAPVEPEPGPVIAVVDLDRDGDGLTDETDLCPAQAGVAPDGCPDEGPQLTRERILTGDRIYFEHGRATLLPESFPVLVKVVALLDQHPQLQVRIEGHTDNTGSEAFNLRLSGDRAAAVRAWLLQASVDPEGLAARLRSQGQGEGQPLDTNRTRRGRAENRRVEFHVLPEPALGVPFAPV